MAEEFPRIERHEAVDRFGRTALRTAADLDRALSDDDRGTDADPVVLRTDGPHRSLAGLAALLDEALADDHGDDRGGASARGAGGSGAG
ncbi:hypothetical protein ACI78V_12300 [Geodermatophilus sp. SYSU D00742]